MDEMEQLRADLDELREDTTHLALAVQNYGQVLASVVRTLENHNIEVMGVKLPTLN